MEEYSTKDSFVYLLDFWLCSKPLPYISFSIALISSSVKTPLASASYKSKVKMSIIIIIKMKKVMRSL